MAFLGGVSSPKSDVMRWEAVQVDVDINRNNQIDQLQSLKGKFIRRSSGNKKLPKLVARSFKKSLQKKAFLKALNVIKTLACGAKLRKRKRKRTITDKECVSTMKFKVKRCEADAVRNTCNESHQSIKPDENCRNKEELVKDQFVQTRGNISEDKFSQTSFLENAAGIACRSPHVAFNPFYPVVFSPFGMCMHTNSLNTCCISSKLQSSQPIPCQREDAGTSPSIGSKHSLKQICEELLNELYKKVNLDSNKMIPTDCNIHTKDGRLSEVPSKPADVSLPCALQNLASDATTVISNFVASPDLYNSLSAKVTCKPSDKSAGNFMIASHTMPYSEPVNLSVTPDLLRDGKTVHSILMKEKTATCTSEVSSDKMESVQIMSMKHSPSELALLKGPVNSMQNRLSNASPLKLIENSNMLHQPVKAVTVTMEMPSDSFQIKSTEQPTFQIGNNSRSAFTSAIKPIRQAICGAENNLPNVTKDIQAEQTVKCLSTVMAKYADQKSGEICSLATDLTNSSIAFDNNLEDIRAKVTKTLFNESLNSQLNDVNESVRIGCGKLSEQLSNSRKSKDTMCNDFSSAKSHHSTTSEVNETTSKSNVNHHEPLNEMKAGRAARNGSKGEPELKVLARVRSADVTRASRKVVNSPAFEEMDSSEMESVLLVWRQQELLHQNAPETQNSASLSPAATSKEILPPCELPPELSSFKVLKPPLPSAMKRDTMNSSVLDLLGEEAKKPIIEDNDDVPENSPRPIIQPPKRRRLRLKPTPRLPVVFEKSKETVEKPKSSDSFSPLTQNVNLIDLTSPTESPDIAIVQENVNENGEPQKEISSFDSEDIPLALRFPVFQSKNITSLAQKTPDGMTQKKTKVSKVAKSDSKNSSEKKKAQKSKSKKKDSSKNCAKSLTNCTNVEVKQCTNLMTEGNNELQLSVDTGGVKGIEKISGKEVVYKHQIEERLDKLKKQWLLEKFQDENVSDLLKARSPSSPCFAKCDQSVIRSPEKVPALKDVPAIEIAKAHDLVTQIILNPWRGISAKLVTRGFVCPKYDTKSVTRALWDLRSNALPQDIVKRIISLKWKNVHPLAFESMLSLFMLTLTRQVPFVIETTNSEDDDDSSIPSDAESISKKKSTPVRVIATKQIFKGECIEGLTGIIMKVSTGDKVTLRSWNCPKFEQGRDWAIFGPLAYLKRREYNFNAQAVFSAGVLVVVKASRQILCGERLLVSLKELENTLNE